MSEDIKALRDGIKELGETLAKDLKAAQEQTEATGKVTTDLTARIDELSEKHVDLCAELDKMAQKAQALPGLDAVKSIGEQFTAADEFKAIADGSAQRVRVEVKNTTINSNLSAVFGDSTTTFPNQRQGVIGGDFIPTTVRAVIPEVPISTDAVNALRESSSNMNAAETAQGALKPESDIAFEQYNVSVETVAHWIKVSNRLLKDAPAIAAYINTRLRDGLAQRVDAQLLNGNGTSPNLSGLTDTGNFTAFSPGADANLVDSINKAKWEMWASGNIPDVAIVNPADWGEMERTREGAGSGMYLYGMPGASAAPSAHGLRVVPSVHMAVGSLLVGALRASALIFNRENVVVEMGYVDDDFTRNLVTIRAEERLALSVDKASALLYGDIARS